MKIIALPFAGGNRYSFTNFLDSSVDLTVFEYPGRGKQVSQDLIVDINFLVDTLFLEISKEVDAFDQYSIYGHSMGALVGYLLCKKISALKIKQPQRLIVSGSRSPSVFERDKISNLSSDKFWEKVNEYGGLPPEILTNKELKTFFEPILRADFRCIEEYAHRADTSKLAIPIDAFYGSEEDIVEEEVNAWKEETSNKVTVTKLKGDHFFIFNHKDFFTNYFENLQLNAII